MTLNRGDRNPVIGEIGTPGTSGTRRHPGSRTNKAIVDIQPPIDGICGERMGRFAVMKIGCGGVEVDIHAFISPPFFSLFMSCLLPQNADGLSWPAILVVTVNPECVFLFCSFHSIPELVLRSPSATVAGPAPSVKSLDASVFTRMLAHHAILRSKKGTAYFSCHHGNANVPCSYLARLEHRIQDIEASLRRLENNQSNGSSSGSSEPIQPSYARNHVHISNNPATLLTPPKSDVLTRSNHITPDRAEFDEIDVSENPIDGMGAINFTDEEDCGFFGKDPSSLTLLQGP